MIKLDQFGKAVWKHKIDKELFVQRDYEWCDRVIVLREHNGRREVVKDTAFSTFNFSDWIPVTVEEMRRVKSDYKEIHDIVTVSKNVASELLDAIDEIAWQMRDVCWANIETWKRLRDAKDAFREQAGL